MACFLAGMLLFRSFSHNVVHRCDTSLIIFSTVLIILRHSGGQECRVLPTSETGDLRMSEQQESNNINIVGLTSGKLS